MLVNSVSPLPTAYAQHQQEKSDLMWNPSFKLNCWLSAMNITHLRSKSHIQTFNQILGFRLSLNEFQSSQLNSKTHNYYDHFTRGDFVLGGNVATQWMTLNDKYMLFSPCAYRQEFFRCPGNIKDIRIEKKTINGYHVYLLEVDSEHTSPQISFGDQAWHCINRSELARAELAQIALNIKL